MFPILLGFRGTCYYYRKAVYRSILQSPTACAVAEPAPRYRGESRFFVFMNWHRYFFYLASLLLLINTYDAVLAFFPPGGFGFGLGSIILVVNVAAAVGLHARLPRVPAHRRRQAQALLAQPAALRDVEPHLDAQRAAHAVRLGVAGERDADRRLHHGRLGRMDLRPADRGVNDMAEHRKTGNVSGETIEQYDYDVVVIGAGGAGLRAAIEARLQGKRTAIISKSLFGKAHTVMAEGGCAAAMGNVNANDNWQVHYRDTMRGGKFLNNWRMAELHAQEAPDRVWELETYGALFDRTKDGKISQRNFGGHTYPRLAHVGDRTGLELIRTLQQKIVSLQQEDFKATGDYESYLRVFHECTITDLFVTDGRIAGCFGYFRSDGRFVRFDAPAIVLATGGVGKSYQVTSNSWEYTGDGHALALRAGATLINMEFLQFHPTGMVWPPSVKGILVTESVRGDGGVLRNSEGKRFMFDYIPDVFREQYATSEAEGDRWYTDPDNNRRPPELLPRDEVARAINSEVKAGRGSPHGGVFLDIASRQVARGDPEASCRRCTTSSRSWRTSTSRRSRWRSAPPVTT